MTAATTRLRLILLAVSTLVTLLACEVWARLRIEGQNDDARADLRAQIQSFRDLDGRDVTPSAGGQATLGDMIRLTANDRIAYELRPNMDGVIFKDRPVTTNSHGFRSPEIPFEAEPDEVTIVAIGDSVLFGHGVGDGESYIDQLQVLLTERRPQKRWRIVNTGVPGYNTVMEVETLVTKGLRFQPDLVIVGVVGNDYEPPVYVADVEGSLDVDELVEERLDLPDPWSLSRSFLVHLIRTRGAAPTATYEPQALVHRNSWSKEHKKGVTAPTRYEGLFGEGAFRDAVKRLDGIWKEEGFELFAFCNISYCEPPYALNKAGEMIAFMDGVGMPARDYQYLIDTALEEQTGKPFNIPDYVQSDLVVNPNNGHPSVKANGMLAEALYLELEQRGVLDRLCQ